MKNSSKSVLLSLISAGIGAIILIGAIKESPALQAKLITNSTNQTTEHTYNDILNKQLDINKDFDSLFHDDFFNSRAPFQAMKKLQEHLEKDLGNLGGMHQSITNSFNSWFSNKFGGGSINDITEKQDNKYLYYEIKLGNLNTASLKTKVENGYITITGTIENKGSSRKSNNSIGYTEQSEYKSTFTRSFPLPRNIDANKMQTIAKKDEIILKFPKIYS